MKKIRKMDLESNRSVFIYDREKKKKKQKLFAKLLYMLLSGPYCMAWL